MLFVLSVSLSPSVLFFLKMCFSLLLCRFSQCGSLSTSSIFGFNLCDGRPCYSIF